MKRSLDSLEDVVLLSQSVVFSGFWKKRLEVIELLFEALTFFREVEQGMVVLSDI